MLTLKQFKEFAPHTKYPDNWHDALFGKQTELDGKSLLEDYDINTPIRVAAFMAQCHHESGGFVYLSENLNYSAKGLMKTFAKYFPDEVTAKAYANNPKRIANRVYANRMGNGPEESAEGSLYKGRGLIQVTGKDNYFWFAASLEMTPEQASEYTQTFEGAAQSACWFWETNKLNRFADAGDLRGMTKVINGGYKGMGFAAPPSSADLKSYVKLKDGSVNIDGLNPAMQERLAGLAKEYYDRTGKKLQINSGFRDSLEQAKLFAKYGSPRAAPPGTSMHEHGLAVDINTSDANEAARLGLMAKYGFSRPVPGETWHLQPVEAHATPDNPYSPGTPIAVAGDGGKAVSPTGAASIDLTAQSAVEKVYADAAAAAPAAVSSTSTSSVAMQDVNPKSAADPRDLGLMSAGADTSMMQDINAAVS